MDYLEVEVGQEEPSKEEYKWRRQVCILDLGKYSLWLRLGPSQIQVMTGHILSGALYFRHFPIRISCPSNTQASLFSCPDESLRQLYTYPL